MSSLRDQGNEQFKAGNYLKAAAIYTQAIKSDPENPALYSNRSAAFLHLSKISKALSDAETAIKLKPEWEKGYFRKGCALEAMEKYEESLVAFKEALKINSGSNEIILKQKFLLKLLKDKKKSNSNSNLNSNSNSNFKPQNGSKNENEIETDFEKRIDLFCKEIFSELSFVFSESKGSLEPSVYFTKEQDKNEGQVNAEKDKNVSETNQNEKNKASFSQVVIKEAFESPTTLSNCVSFLRNHAMEENSFASFLLVLKKKISFPQVWKGRGAKEWMHGNKNGVFAQLENKKRRKIWFIPIHQKEGKSDLGTPEELDIETYAILPPLFR